MGEGRVLLEAGKGVAADEVAALRAVDPRPPAYWELESELTALTVAVAAEVAASGLDGRRVAIEGFDGAGPALVATLVERGAQVVAIATAAGTAVAPDGFDPAVVGESWAAHGPDLVTTLDPDAGRPWAVFGTAAEILVVGSKPGVVDHTVAAGLVADCVVAGGPVPVTAKGLAVARRAGRVVIPDFLSTAGPLFAGWPASAGGDPRAEAAERGHRRGAGGARPRRRPPVGCLPPGGGLSAHVARGPPVRATPGLTVSDAATTPRRRP